MKIGFDAKRAFHNTTGLGNYSRTLISSLVTNYPGHDYYLFNPKKSTIRFENERFHEVGPSGFMSQLFPAAWRSRGIISDLQKLEINIYHGLSHELPFNIHRSGVRSVVTIHDLIPERFPNQYNPVDVRIYHKKFTYACRHADKIIAISKQTKEDIIEFYGIDPSKIEICYQSCDPSFSVQVSQDIKKKILQKYNLPETFYLTVGSIIERKNLLSLCKGLSLKNDPAPLVVIGDGGKYKEIVKRYLLENKLENKVIFLSEAMVKPEFIDFPAIYQSAIAMIYPSTFEGFGIPVLEALFSGLPVITSNVSSLPEAGGNAAMYIDPHSPEHISQAMTLVTNSDVRNKMIDNGLVHAQNFKASICAASVMKVYQSLW